MKGALIESAQRLFFESAQWGFASGMSARLKQGASMSAFDASGFRALHICARRGREKALGMLIRKGDHPLGLALNGQSALGLAIRARQLGCVKILLASADWRGVEGSCDGGAPFVGQAARAGDIEMMRALIGAGLSAAAKSPLGKSSAFYACASLGSPGARPELALELALACGSDALAPGGPSYWTPLEALVSAASGSRGGSKACEIKACLAQLIARGADPFEGGPGREPAMALERYSGIKGLAAEALGQREAFLLTKALSAAPSSIQTQARPTRL